MAAPLSADPTVAPALHSALPVFAHPHVPNAVVREERIRSRAGGVERRLLLDQPGSFPVHAVQSFSQKADGSWELRREELFRADQMLVGGNVTPEALEAFARAEGLAFIPGQVPNVVGLRLTWVSLDRLDQLQIALQALPGAEHVSGDYLVMPAFVPNDPSYGSQWQVKNIKAEQAWDIQATAWKSDRQPTVIAVVDTGSPMTDTDLEFWQNPGETPGNGLDDDANGLVDDVNGWNFVENNNYPNTGGHGAEVTRIAGSRTNNGVGRSSPAGRVQIMAVRALPDGTSGSLFAVLNAFYYAVSKKADVINCSFIGGSAYYWDPAVASARSAGIIVVAGAGNSNIDLGANGPGSFFPACAAGDNLIAVGAVNSSDVPANTNYGAPYIDVFAPGGATSYSTPIVSSMVAWLIGDDPVAPLNTIVSRVMNGVDVLPSTNGKVVSNGRVNLQKSAALNTMRRPDGLTATPAPLAIDLSWNDRASTETGFIVERSTKNPDTFANPDAAGWTTIATSVPSNSESYRDSTVAAGTTYYYRLRAKGSPYNSAPTWVTKVSAKPLAEAPLPAPSGFGNSAAATSIFLWWTDNASDETGYTVERRRAGDSSFTRLATLAPNSRTYKDIPLTPGTTYTYRISAVRGSVTASAPDYTVNTRDDLVILIPLPPTGLSAVAESSSSVRLAWVDGSNNESGFRIQMRTGSGSYTTLSPTIAGNTTSAVIDNLSPSTSYTFRLQSFNSSGNSTWSNEATVTTPEVAAPTAVSGPTELPAGWPLPVVGWMADEGTGRTLFDLSNNNLDGSLLGGVNWGETAMADGKRYYALDFDGSTGRVLIPDSSLINAGTTLPRLTLSAWFRLDSFKSGAPQVIWEQGGEFRGLNLYVRAGRLYAGGWNRDSGQSNWLGTFLRGPEVSLGEWYHVAVVLDGGSTLSANAFKLYVNGLLAASGEGSQLWSHSDDIGLGTVAGSTRLDDGSVVRENYFSGMIDQVLIYHQALSDTQLQAAVSSADRLPPAVASLTGAVANWTFSEGSGSITREVSNALNGTLEGDAGWEALEVPGNPWALRLAGNGRVRLPDSLLTNLNLILPSYTISLWFRPDNLGLSRTQVIYEQGGASRGMSAYLMGGRLYAGAWNAVSYESNWGGSWIESQPLIEGRWYNLVMVLEGGWTVADNSWRVYLDGDLLGTAPGSQLWGHVGDAAIGGVGDFSLDHNGQELNSSHNFVGIIDSMAIAHRALTALEVSLLAQPAP